LYEYEIYMLHGNVATNCICCSVSAYICMFDVIAYIEKYWISFSLGTKSFGCVYAATMHSGQIFQKSKKGGNNYVLIN